MLGYPAGFAWGRMQALAIEAKRKDIHKFAGMQAFFKCLVTNF